MVFSPIKTTGTNDVSFYVDDMANAQLTADSLSPYVGYNMIETQQMTTQDLVWPHAGDAQPQTAVYDDVNVASLPGVLYVNASPTTVTPGTQVNVSWDGVGADLTRVVGCGGYTYAGQPVCHRHKPAWPTECTRIRRRQ